MQDTLIYWGWGQDPMQNIERRYVLNWYRHIVESEDPKGAYYSKEDISETTTTSHKKLKCMGRSKYKRGLQYMLTHISNETGEDWRHLLDVRRLQG